MNVETPQMSDEREDIRDADEHIMQFLYDTDSVLTPGCIGRNIGGERGYNEKYVGRRCRQLVEWGYLAKEGRGWYCIAVKGRMYLAGELDAEELEESDE